MDHRGKTGIDIIHHWTHGPMLCMWPYMTWSDCGHLFAKNLLMFTIGGLFLFLITYTVINMIGRLKRLRRTFWGRIPQLLVHGCCTNWPLRSVSTYTAHAQITVACSRLSDAGREKNKPAMKHPSLFPNPPVLLPQSPPGSISFLSTIWEPGTGYNHSHSIIRNFLFTPFVLLCGVEYDFPVNWILSCLGHNWCFCCCFCFNRESLLLWSTSPLTEFSAMKPWMLHTWQSSTKLRALLPTMTWVSGI